MQRRSTVRHSFIVTGGAVCIRGLVLAGVFLGGGLQSATVHEFSAGAEGVVERGRESGNICGDVWKNLWSRLIIVADQ